MTTDGNTKRDDPSENLRPSAARNGDGERLEPGQWLIQQIDEIFADITDEEWAEWTETDASEQLDHYLYGSPKRETRKFKSDAPSSTPPS